MIMLSHHCITTNSFWHAPIWSQLESKGRQEGPASGETSEYGAPFAALGLVVNVARAKDLKGYGAFPLGHIRLPSQSTTSGVASITTPSGMKWKMRLPKRPPSKLMAEVIFIWERGVSQFYVMFRYLQKVEISEVLVML